MGTSPRGAAVQHPRLFHRPPHAPRVGRGGGRPRPRPAPRRGARLPPRSRGARRPGSSTWTRLRAQSQMDVSVAGEALGATEEGAARTTPLPGTKAVAGRTCRGFRIAAPQASLEVYVAQVGGGHRGLHGFSRVVGGGPRRSGPCSTSCGGSPGSPWRPASAPRCNGRERHHRHHRHQDRARAPRPGPVRHSRGLSPGRRSRPPEED